MRNYDEFDFDNTIILHDEDGDEVKFEIAHSVDYRGKKYYVLWAEETDDMMFVMKDSDGDYVSVDDDEALDYVKKSFVEEMINLKMEIDAMSDDVDDFMSELESITSSSEDEPIADYSDARHEPSVAVFDYNKYVLQSQDYSFKQAMIAYENEEYNRALELFKEATYQGNAFAYAHIGIMYHQGEGCEKNEELALSAFREGAKQGCPLAACWITEFYRMGYAVEKDKEYALKLQKKSVNALEKMCNAEDVAALYFLGFNLIYGIGTDINEEKGVRLLEVGAYKGDTSCTVQLAECYLNGWGVAENQEKAFQMLNGVLKLNKKGNYLLGRCYYYGFGTEQDYFKAVKYFKKAADMNHGAAKDYLGDCYYNGQGVSQNYSEAARWYKDAADNNNIGNSAHSLAFMYMKGEGVPEDEHKAIDYWLIAADKGIAQAQRIISREYLSGEYLRKDNNKAKEYMTMAAEKGDSEAQFTLGRYYISGLGFDDDQKCFEWIKKAAEQGHVEAEYVVGGCYKNEVGVKQDYSQANSWYQIAVKDGHKRAAYDLGVNYLEGRGIEKDVEVGIQLLEIASEGGIREACRELASIYHYGVPNFRGQELYKNPSEAQRLASIAVQDETDGTAQCILAKVLDEDFDNYQVAIEWYRRAVANGNKEAMLGLSRIYVNTQSNCQDAVKMLLKLVEGKNGEAQYLYARCLENGYGCVKDKREAKKYYQMAQNNGHASVKPKKRFGFF